ncbi:MAG: hypothetical protein LBD20_06215 [Spirochaetaceae bacterium]|nr:hypothetical protein [Spirochaetaceae bacterium]
MSSSKIAKDGSCFSRHGWRGYTARPLRGLGQSNNSVTTLLFVKLKNRHGWRFLSQIPLLSLARLKAIFLYTDNVLMDIYIDGKDANITLDTEKTLGDVLAGISEYLEHSGFLISAVELDGTTADGEAVAGLFQQPLSNVHKLNVQTRTAAEMALDALLQTQDIISSCENTIHTDKKLYTAFINCPPVTYLEEKENGIYNLIISYISNGMYNELKQELQAVIDERKNEITCPKTELKAMAEDVTAVCRRLEEFPLDVQTGKDAKAAETVEQCAFILQKFFRLLLLSRFYGVVHEAVLAGDEMNEFNAVLKEFLAAYENNDIVLSGDLAEYELAPRFRHLYASLTGDL